MKKIITYGLYPILLIIVLAIIFLAINFNSDYKVVYGATTVFLVLTLMITETFFPLNKEWKMTKKSFWRDLKYILIGTETHRYHHSANIDEAKNYGNTLAIWDIIFGTFYYKPGTAPKKLGMDNPNEYPKSENLFDVVSLPFRK